MNTPKPLCNAGKRCPVPAAVLLLTLASCEQPATVEHDPIEVDLVTLEDCQRTDLLRKRRFIFHLYDCFAEVQLSETGEVLSFKPLDGKEEICRKVIEECRWQ